MEDSCCTVELDGEKVHANIKQKGRGKFEITEGENTGKVVDASKIVDCKC